MFLCLCDRYFFCSLRHSWKLETCVEPTCQGSWHSHAKSGRVKCGPGVSRASMNLTIWSFFSFVPPVPCHLFSFVIVWTLASCWLLEEKKSVGASVVRNKSHITKQRELQIWGNGDCDTFAVSGRFWFRAEAWQDIGPQDSSNLTSVCFVGVSECQLHNIWWQLCMLAIAFASSRLQKISIRQRAARHSTFAKLLNLYIFESLYQKRNWARLRWTRWLIAGDSQVSSQPGRGEGVFVLLAHKSNEQWPKSLLFAVYRGLHYPVVLYRDYIKPL